MKFYPDNSAFSYMGRIDFHEKNKPLFIYAGSMVEARFKGTSLKISVKNCPFNDFTSIGAVVDGVQHKIVLEKTRDEKSYTVVENLDAEKIHTLTIFKRQAAAHYFRFTGVEIEGDAELLPIDNERQLKLEFFGDSVSAGEVVEAVYYEGQCDPENHGGIYDNSWFSYTLSSARKLNAQIHNNSQGGIALLDKTGYFNGPDLETMLGVETTYNKLSYVPYSDEKFTDWDFKRYNPDIVVFAIGQNDANPDPQAVRDPEYAEKWLSTFEKIVRDLQHKYGKNTKFIFLLTLLKHYPIWDDILDRLCDRLNDDNIRRLRFKRCGQATDGHPRITEQEEMALELEAFIRSWLKI